MTPLAEVAKTLVAKFQRLAASTLNLQYFLHQPNIFFNLDLPLPLYIETLSSPVPQSSLLAHALPPEPSSASTTRAVYEQP